MRKYLSLFLTIIVLCGFTTSPAGVRFGNAVEVTDVAGGETVIILGDIATDTSNNTLLSASSIRGRTQVAIATGTLKNGYIYWAENASVDTKLVIFDAAENKIAESDIVSSQTLNTYVMFPFSGDNQISIVNGTTYRAGLMGASNYRPYSGATNVEYGAVTWPTSPDPFASDGVIGSRDWVANLYLEGTT